MIFDTVGKSSFSTCRKALKSNGKYIVTLMNFKVILQSLLTRLGNNKKVIFAMSLNKTEALNYIRTLIEEGALKTIIDREFPMEELMEAHAYVEKGHKKGNVAISVHHE